MIFADLFTQQW